LPRRDKLEDGLILQALVIQHDDALARPEAQHTVDLRRLLILQDNTVSLDLPRRDEETVH
jgi:hypothetical protein